MSYFPMQLAWKVKQDRVSQSVAKTLWTIVNIQAICLGAKNNYDYINSMFDKQIKLFQVNNVRRIS